MTPIMHQKPANPIFKGKTKIEAVYSKATKRVIDILILIIFQTTNSKQINHARKNLVFIMTMHKINLLWANQSNQTV